ncbi:Hsp33 family molecular chaperone HslO [Paenibacillus sp. MBLB4367]|uniref:Hsp33 family molecular chaperone HslO n=1 Tax=Paenibacillus sp. MBLB4367 TaxID=3384767 RepID=UPI0039083770
MYEENYLVKALAYRNQVRILFIKNTELVRAACNRRPMHPMLRIALGRTVSAASLLTGIKIPYRLFAGKRKERPPGVMTPSGLLVCDAQATSEYTSR